jgi:hypothetical protein
MVVAERRQLSWQRGACYKRTTDHCVIELKCSLSPRAWLKSSCQSAWFFQESIREGRVAPEDATARAEKIFQDEAEERPEFIASLLKEFHDQPEVQHQIDLPPDVTLVEGAENQFKLRIEASSGATPSAPTQDHARISIRWKCGGSPSARNEISESKR